MCRMRCRTVAMFLLVVAAMVASAEVAIAQTSAPAKTESNSSAQPVPAAIVELRGVIDDFSRDSLFKRFDQATAAGAKVIILKLNTPGGLASAGLDISRFLRSQSDVRTVAFVDGKALSAGIMVGLAADKLVMAPGSLIGDSAPI